MKRMLTISITLMILLRLFTLNVFGQEEKNILIIHAYHFGYTWTYNQNEGIREALLAEFPDANIYTEFLDWKRFPSEEILQSKYEEFSKKYKAMNIDLLVTTDDAALEFAIAHRGEIFNNVPITFGGIIENTAMEIIGEEQNITGVYENINAEDIFKLCQTIQPEVDKLIFIYDQSESGLRTADIFYHGIESLKLSHTYTVEDWADKSYLQIKDDIKELNEDSAVMFFSYSSSADGVIKSYDEFGRELLSLSPVPVYSNYENMFGQGIIGGSFLSGELQGVQLGELGIKVLNGSDPDSIAHISKATVYTGVDALALERFHIDVNLDDEVVIKNEHFSFFETYKNLVLMTLAIFMILIALILILLRLHRIIRKSNRKILEQKVEVQALYESVQVSEEELKAQNDELEKYQEYLKYEARHDFLTKLPNRIALNQFLEEKISAVDIKKSFLVVIFIDLDNFKFINNTYGHHFGDQVLMTVANRLTQLKGEAFVSRLGGDEFIMVSEFAIKEKEATIQHLGLLINQAVSKVMNIDEEKVLIKASLGYSIFPEDGHSFEELIIEADTAMYHAKKTGKATTLHYNKAMSNIFQNEYLLVSSLKEAYEENEFFLMYQPIMTSDGSSVKYFEALVRWQSKVHGFIPPDIFIGLAETSGLIIPIGYYVIDQAIAFAKKLKALGREGLLVSINISIIQFYEDNFVDILLNKLASAELSPENIEIEITESVLIEAFSMIIKKLEYLNAKGISVSLDDFGTGYSSLSYLNKLPIQKIKIDKIFVDDILDEDTNVPLINATITLANSFNLEIVAEGVEDQWQLDYLAKNGCQGIQGYYFSQPLIEEEAIKFLSDFSH